ncbi:hypothetical protein NDI44_27205 [Trichocoleus sp. DQ-A3]|uniref:hypothetical protein n=1 Tax=Cyanophyceae TaxID=3028117 RepID=UPI0016852C41|nr:hypothetical protein [Coleofasciculus sp. FACHB-125]MBD1903875.1 hypothetical protein [Coleofasciculus sp. FACHB-125]
MRTRSRRRIKNISIASLAIACCFGFLTLLIQPKELHKGMLLAFGFGLCCGIRLTED